MSFIEIFKEISLNNDADIFLFSAKINDTNADDLITLRKMKKTHLLHQPPATESPQSFSKNLLNKGIVSDSIDDKNEILKYLFDKQSEGVSDIYRRITKAISVGPNKRRNTKYMINK